MQYGSGTVTHKLHRLLFLAGLAATRAFAGDAPLPSTGGRPIDPRFHVTSAPVAGPTHMPLAEEIVTEAVGPPIELVGSCCGTSMDYCDFPNWYFRADLLVFQRDTDESRLLASFRQLPNGVPIPFTSQDIGFDNQPGFRVTAGKAITCVSAFEVSGMVMEDDRPEAGADGLADVGDHHRQRRLRADRPRLLHDCL